jgi:long-chain acyl-CoA synthetase
MNTLVELLEGAAAAYSDRTALSMQAGLRTDNWSYRRLWRAAHAVARHLRHEHRIEPGERVLVQAPNCPQLVAAYFGCMLAGIVLVPLDPFSSEEFMAAVVAKTQARAVLTVDTVRSLPECRTISLSSLPFDQPGPPVEHRPAPGDLAEIVFTSGTTGSPKGVMLTHANIAANVASLDSIIPRGRHYRLLSLLPLSHMLEQTVGLYLPLSYGATIYYPPGRHPGAILRTLQKRRIIAMVVVPAILQILLRAIEREVQCRGRWQDWQRLHALAAHLPVPTRRLLFRQVHRSLGGCLEFVMCGGAYLPLELAQAWERLGVKVVQGYGATECAPVVATNTLTDRVHTSVGRPVRRVQVRISDEGELLVKGPNVTSGYWQDEAATRAAFTEDGWYRTGDLAWQDASGRLSLKGRLKDMIVLPNGMNVYPEDVEHELEREDAVAACVVVGLPEADGGQRVHAVVLPRHRERSEAELAAEVEAAVRRANARLAPHQRIATHSLWPGEDFPRTTSLKIRRHEVMAALSGAAPVMQERPASPRPGDRQVRLYSIIAEIARVPIEQVHPASELSADLGIDSLGRVELALRLEEELGVTLDDGQLAEAQTVAQLAALVEQGPAPATALPFPRWALGLPARLTRRVLQELILWPLHRLLCWPFRVAGQEHLRSLAPDPVLFIANHTSHLDTPSVLRALPPHLRRRVAVAAAADYFYRNPLLGAVVSLLLNSFPFARQGAIGASLEYCGELVDAGWSLLVYPEGTRSPTGELQPFKTGIGLLARELRVPVVPVAIRGTYAILPRGTWRPRPGPVSIRFGTPMALPAHLTPEDATATLQAELARLLQCR